MRDPSLVRRNKSADNLLNCLAIVWLLGEGEGQGKWPMCEHERGEGDRLIWGGVNVSGVQRPDLSVVRTVEDFNADAGTIAGLDKKGMPRLDATSIPISWIEGVRRLAVSGSVPGEAILSSVKDTDAPDMQEYRSPSVVEWWDGAVFVGGCATSISTHSTGWFCNKSLNNSIKSFPVFCRKWFAHRAFLSSFATCLCRFLVILSRFLE